MDHEWREKKGDYHGDGKSHPVHGNTSHQNASSAHFSYLPSALLQESISVHSCQQGSVVEVTEGSSALPHVEGTTDLIAHPRPILDLRVGIVRTGLHSAGHGASVALGHPQMGVLSEQ